MVDGHLVDESGVDLVAGHEGEAARADGQRGEPGQAPRRQVEISGQGLELLDSLDEKVLDWLQEMLSPLDKEELQALCTLTEKARVS